MVTIPAIICTIINVELSGTTRLISKTVTTWVNKPKRGSKKALINKGVNTTGAGDAFGSGFVAGLMAKNDINFALRLAAANATSVVEHIGAQEGILTKSDFSKPRFKYLDLDVEPL